MSVAMGQGVLWLELHVLSTNTYAIVVVILWIAYWRDIVVLSVICSH